MLQECYMARMTTKICPVCGSEFKGTDGKITCGNACRTAAVRMRQKGKKMEFALIAKTKGQKLPAPKPLKTTRPEPTNFSSIVDIIKELPSKQELPKIEAHIAPQKPDITTLEQRWSHNDRINNLIKEEKAKKMPPGMLVRRWALLQQDIISELEKQIIQ